jgi:hypothetical protein
MFLLISDTPTAARESLKRSRRGSSARVIAMANRKVLECRQVVLSGGCQRVSGQRRDIADCIESSVQQ